MQRSTELTEALQHLYDAVSRGDGSSLSEMMSSREGLVFVGTDPDEWYEDAVSIRAMLEAQAGAGIKVRGGEIAAYEEGTVGWAADRGVFVLPDGSEVPFRFTVVFHREAGAWKIVQEHASVAVSNEDALGDGLDAS
jgi:ketosteroid isomerase-like protein